MRKVIISDGENNDNFNTCIKCGKEIPEGDIYCDSCAKSAEAENEKPRFPYLDRSLMKNQPRYEDDDEYTDDEDEAEDTGIGVSHENRTRVTACIFAGAVVIALSFLILGIFIGKNSTSPFVEHFKLHEKTIYIDVIED